MPKNKYNPSEREKHRQQFRLDNEVYKFDVENKDGKPNYTVDTPPTTVSGKIHMGHTLSYTQAEVMVRYKRMTGHNVYYPFGTDTNGLPTIALIEKEIGKRCSEMSKAEFTEIAMQLIDKYIDQYKTFRQNLGYSNERSQTYTTIEPMVQRLAQERFLEMVKQGQVFRKKFPALRSTTFQTSIAQAEVESKEFDSVFYDLKFEILSPKLLGKQDPQPPLRGLGRGNRPPTPSEGALQTSDRKSWKLELTKEDVAKRGLVRDGDHFPYNPNNIDKAKDMRRNPTKAEKKLRDDFLSKHDYKFYRQRPIDHFIADFYCSKADLIIEVDGGVHKGQQEYDEMRTELFNLYGLQVIRFSNKEIFNDFDNVCKKIDTFLASPLRGGQGGSFKSGQSNLPGEVGKEALQSAKINIPTFITDTDIPHEDAETVQKDIMLAVIKNPKNNKFLVLDWVISGAKHFLGGGIEEGEDPVATGKREILEETGYKNLKFIKYLPATASHYRHSVKEVNYKTINVAVYFELENEEQEQVDEKELAKHEFHWINESELIEYLNVKEAKYLYASLNDDKKMMDELVDGFMEYDVENGKFTREELGNCDLELSTGKEMSHGFNKFATHKHTDDGFIYTVRAIIKNEKGEILMIMKDKKNGFPSVPGGKVKKNETEEEALARELQEEIGVSDFTAQHSHYSKAVWKGGRALLSIYEVILHEDPSVQEFHHTGLEYVSIQKSESKAGFSIITSDKIFTDTDEVLRNFYDIAAYLGKDILTDKDILSLPHQYPSRENIKDDDVYIEYFDANKNVFDFCSIKSFEKNDHLIPVNTEIGKHLKMNIMQYESYGKLIIEKLFSDNWKSELSKYKHTEDGCIYSVRAVIKNKEGQYLCMHDHRRDAYNFPGGKADKGETLEEALRREVKEEIGVDVKIIKKVLSSKGIRRGGMQCNVYYECEMMGEPEIKEKDKFTDIFWGEIQGNEEIYIGGKNIKEMYKEEGDHLRRRHCYDLCAISAQDNFPGMHENTPFEYMDIDTIKDDEIYLTIYSDNKFHNIKAENKENYLQKHIFLAKTGKELKQGMQKVFGKDPQIPSKGALQGMKKTHFPPSEGGLGRVLPIATTRPELLPACVAVFVHPDDERYTHLLGATIKTPLGDEVKLLADDRVQMDKGTGAVMCCTYGDENDMYRVQTHNLSEKVIVDKRGKIAGSGIAQLEGLKVKQARKVIIDEILEPGGFVLDAKPIRHDVGTHERDGSPIEIISVDQRFVNILPLKDKIIEQGAKMKRYPEFMFKRFKDRADNIKRDRCITRNKPFGISIPVWYSKKTGEVVLPDADQLPCDPTTTLPKTMPAGHTADDLIPEKDVFDTRFTSGITPYINYISLKERHGLQAGQEDFLPMSMRPQAHDIIRTWDFYTVIQSMLHENNIPFDEVVISGHVLAKRGEKISKSKGNAKFTPEEMIEQFGADAVRYRACSGQHGKDMIFEETELKNGQRLVNKIRNAFTFAKMQLEDFDIEATIGKPEAERDENYVPPKEFSDLYPTDKRIYAKLTITVDKMTKYLEKYEYGLAKLAFEEFFRGDFCDTYLEMIKTRLYKPELFADGQDKKLSGQSCLYDVFYQVLQLIAPYMPHITEELYQEYYKQTYKTISIHLTQYPTTETVCPMNVDQAKKLDEDFEQVRKVIESVRGYKTANQMGLGTELERVLISGSEEDLAIVRQYEDDLRGVCKAGKIEYGNGEWKVECG